MLVPLAISVLLYVLGGIASLLLRRTEIWAVRAGGLAAAVAGIFGVGAALPVLLGAHTATFATSGPFPFASFSLRLDPLAALMVLIVSLVAIAASIYSLAYLKEYFGRGVGVMGFFMNLFIASMVMVAVVDNAFYFLLFWEAMTLASYFLVVFDQDQEAIDAGFLYFFIAHGFSMLIMVAFLLLYMQTGSLEFGAFRAAHPPSWLGSIIFLLAFFGFGAKAGVMPLHIWLPRAHPAAPSHASALMSGVMIKFGIYGILRVGIEILGAGTVWWGWMVLGFGALSAVFGVLYALPERDVKRLLAYSSVENIGIILIGVGVGMVGIADRQPALTALGLLAGLYHLLNHAAFKGLLFLGAGAVLHTAGTRDMTQLGGLGRRARWTAVCFLIGALSISAIPPLNGFVGEWFTYQALFVAGHSAQFASRLLAPLTAMMLAVTGALVLMCFVNAWGMIFAGAPRSDRASQAREVPVSMLTGMGGLALTCLLLGLGAPIVAPILSRVVAATASLRQLPVASGAMIFPGDAHQATLSPPLVALLMLGLLALPLVIATIFRRQQLVPHIALEDWACGYQHTGKMTVSSMGFGEPLRVMFRWLYRVRDVERPLDHAASASVEGVTALAGRVEPMWDRATTQATVGGAERLGRQIQALQSGDLRTYCVYIFLALTAVLLAVVR